MAPEQRLATLAAALVAGFLANAAQAAPIATSAIDLKVATQEASYTDRIASRRCWWRNGERHCVKVGGSRVYGARGQQGSDYYEHIPEKLPYGSSSWWDQMVRENRGGNSGGGGRN
jgi:hypothetical protein